jgi:hypothetical protein
MGGYSHICSVLEEEIFLPSGYGGAFYSKSFYHYKVDIKDTPTARKI